MSTKRKYIFKPGQSDSRGDVVKRWDTINGIPVCVRAGKTRRYSDLQYYPLPEWTEEEDEKLDVLRERLAKEKAKNFDALPERNQKIVTKNIAEWEKIIAEKEEERKPLTEWEDEQIRRCFQGHGTLTGRHYFYYNFCWIQNISKSGARTSIRPHLRMADDFFSRLIEQIDNAKPEERGFVAPKKRRIGLTWLNATMVTLYDTLFLASSNFYTSKSESNIIDFYNRVIFANDKLPRFLRMAYVNKSPQKRTLKFSPNQRITEFLKANPYICREFNIEDEELEHRPDPELLSGTVDQEDNFAGFGVGRLIVDEAGEIENLRDILQWGMPMLNGSDGFTRVGTLLIYGTVGQMTTSGQVLKKIFDNAAIYKCIKILFPGWMGVTMDEYGNDEKERVLKMIHEERDNLERSGMIKELITFKQKYPLSLEDAFSYASEYDALPVHIIAKFKQDHEANTPSCVYGLFRRNQDGKVIFDKMMMGQSAPTNPNWEGYNQWTIFEDRRDSNLRYPYVGGCDPVAQDKSNSQRRKEKRYRASDISAVIFKRFQTIGGIANAPVAYYHGRPDLSEDAFVQIVLACMYYNAPMNIERQKGVPLFNTFRNMNQENLIAMNPGALLGLTQNPGDWGFANTPKWWTQMIALYRKYWVQNMGNPHHIRLYDEAFVLGQENTDMTVAMLSALMLDEELNERVKANIESNEQDPPKERFRQGWVNKGGVWRNNRPISKGAQSILNRRAS